LSGGARTDPLEALRGGGKRAMARALAQIEAAPGEDATIALLDAAFADPRAHVVGITGPPGVGKSSLVSRLIALYRARIAELQPGQSASAPPPSGYGWLMGDWTVAAIRKAPADPRRADTARAQLGRTLHFAKGPVSTLGGASCSFPRYSAEPAPGPQFGDLSDYPAAVMVRLSCVGVALLDVVRLTDEKILIGEGDAVFELERRR